MARDVAAAPTTSPSRVVMMSARSKPQPPPPAPAPSIYSYLHSQSGLNFAPVVQQQTSSSGEGSPPPAPPVRDASSLKNIKYGPGHEKFPSWPSDTPRPAAPGGGSHRSKSWTDHTNYPKEKGITYTRPYMKRPNPAFTQQLKTVMEKCEKIPPETFESRPDGEQGSRMYLPRVDREGKALGDNDYMVPSPPERDVMSTKPQLTQADLEEYARSYQDPPQLTQVELEEYARSYQEPKPQSAHLTQADLEEYARTYEESLRPQHQQQQSYAQSEGYHSYVSSTDSITTTPFLDRLRRDSEATARPITITQSSSWDESSGTDRPGRDSVVTTSSGSASSSETLKWHGSLSDVSVASSSCLAPTSSRQLIAHSARVQTPQRHHSESVLYLGNSNWVQRNNHHNQLRLFPVNTYTVQPSEQPQPQQQQSSHRMTPMSPPPPTLSVAERISELERQQTRYTYLDPEKRHRVSDPTLKAIQKKALLSFYERHHSANNSRNQTWRSEPQLAQPTSVAPQSPPPQPPPRPRGNQSGRRASSASDYAGGNWREAAANRENGSIEPGSIQDNPRHQHSSSCGSLSADLLGPLIIGPSISVDDWVPERPPKKPHLRAAFAPPVPDRLPSPDLPPPSPPPVLEDEVFVSDEPLPPPPPELHSPDWNETETSQRQQQSPRSSSAHPQSPKQERSPEENETQNDSSRPQRSFVGASLQEHCESSNSLQVPIALNATKHISNNNTNSSMSSSNNNINNNNHSQRPHDANTQEKHNNVNQNGISSQRNMDRAFSLSRSIEDCSSQKSSQRQNSVTQRYREGTPALKPITNGTSKSESSYQQYRSSTTRYFENGQKLSDCSSLPRSNGSATSLLQKYQDSNNRISQLNYVPAYKNMNETFSRTSSIRQHDTSMTRLSGSRSSLRYPTTQKLMVNGKLFSEHSPHLERGTSRTSSILLPPKTHFQRFTEASTEDKSSSQQSLAQQDPPPTVPRLSIHNPQYKQGTENQSSKPVTVCGSWLLKFHYNSTSKDGKIN